MKKATLLGMVILVLFSMLGWNTGHAQAAGMITYRGGLYVWGKGVVFVFDGAGYRNKDLRDANIFAGSNYHDLSCRVNKDENKIVCVGRGDLTQYADQTGIIYLAGQVFYVTIPDKPALPETSAEGPLTCAENEVMGAWVEFSGVFIFGPFSFSDFIEGDSPEAVEQAALAFMSDIPFITGYEVGEFGCFEPPAEEEL